MPLRTGAVFLVKLLSLGGQFHGIGPHVGAGPLQQPLFLEADDEARYRRLVASGRLCDGGLRRRLLEPEIFQDAPLLGGQIRPACLEGADDRAARCVVRLVKPKKRVGAWFESRALGNR